ncbi:hypothetical protein C6341_g15097 [Phytophthora cactorum]|nr:hypothetical protein C6341_g15097 [Phytophthora cactorum]
MHRVSGAAKLDKEGLEIVTMVQLFCDEACRVDLQTLVLILYRVLQDDQTAVFQEGFDDRRGEEFEDQTHNKKYSTEVPEDALLLNESFSVYRVLYLCTHAGNPRDRSSGKRPSRNVRPVRRGAQYQFTKRFTTTYSGKGSRGIPQKILKYIWENTDSEPCMVDVHNLLAKLKREEDAVNNEWRDV